MNGVTGGTGGPAAGTNGSPARPHGPVPVDGRAGDSRYRQVVAAWERFAAGDDDVGGVRPLILMSWYRCREEYKVDPQRTQAPPAGSQAPHSLEHDTVFAELGGLAALAERQLGLPDGLVTVTDCAGRILASWGDEGFLRDAEQSNLAPWASWSERSSGTNGMGTSLESRRVVVVEGPEHWCQGFHDWSCAGVAIRDVVSGEPLAVLNISCRRADLPGTAVEWLHQAAQSIQARLRRLARDSGTELVAAFAQAGPTAPVPVAALDTAGKVVIANEEAAVLLGVPPDTPATDPAQRWTSQVPELKSLAGLAARHGQRDPQWAGATQLFVPLTSSLLRVAVRPVFRANKVVGMLLAGGPALDDPVTAAPPRREGHTLTDRVIGRRGTRLVVLSLPEIRFAEADGSTVWLTSDQGRLQATTQGLDHLEQQLARHGFLRVHRRYLVNLRRVKEIEQGFKGALYVVTDVRAHESVPVSRRHAPGLRRALGI
jgi:sigma-54 dependent transcriptional regulator, acetoin dehydrogenase operon transcriptional activator AcoR